MRNAPQPLGPVPFTDGKRRPAYAGRDGRQFVFGDDGERVYGGWVNAEVDLPQEPYPCPHRG